MLLSHGRRVDVTRRVTDAEKGSNAGRLSRWIATGLLEVAIDQVPYQTQDTRDALAPAGPRWDVRSSLQQMANADRPPARLGRPTPGIALEAIAVQPADQLTSRQAPVADIGRHPAFVYLARLAPGSRPTIEGALAATARAIGGAGATIATFPWSELRYQHTAALRSALWDRYAPATANKILAAVRGVLREAWRLRLIAADDYQRAVDVGAIRGSRPPHGRHLAADEIRALFHLCATDASPAGIRDAALLGVLYGAGLRRAEVVALSLPDYAAEDGALIVRGKGNKVRVAYLRGGAAQALAAWLTVRGPSA